MKCILLAVDDRPFKGIKNAPYTLNTMGLPLFAQGISAIQNAGYDVECVMATSIQEQLSKLDSKIANSYQASVYSQETKWLDAYGSNVVILLDAAVYYLGNGLIHGFKTRSLSVGKEPVVYRVGDRPVALIARADMLKSVWNKAKPDVTKRRFMTQLVLAMQEQQISSYEDTLRMDEAVVVDQLYAHHLIVDFLRDEKLKQLMGNGVQILDRHSTFIDSTVQIEEGTIVYPGCVLEGLTSIGSDCEIGPGARIANSKIGSNVVVKDSTLTDASVDDHTAIGPYAYLRPKSDIGKHVKIGDFVEVKNARIDDYSKVSHLSYIGDGSVGKNVNVGCGVVFVNYDGKNKHLTTIEDNAFIGCNANLVAPVTVKRGAYVAAGSTITEDVEVESLAIARCRQTQKLNWVKNKK